VLGELANLADSLPAHLLAVLVLTLEPQEANLRVSRLVCDVLAGLFEALSCFQDGLGENIDITSGLILRLGGKKDKIHGNWRMYDKSTHYRLGHVGR